MSTQVEATPGLSVEAQLRALHRLALALGHPGGPDLYEHLVRELAQALQVAAVFVAVFADERRSTMRSLAGWLDGALLPPFEYPLAGSPCEKVTGKAFRYMVRGVRAEMPPDEIFAQVGMDSYAAYPLEDSAGQPLGLVAAMDRLPIANGDAAQAEAILKIVAVRLVAELERTRAEQALQRSAASYRAIFEASEDPIFVHDWDSGRILDVNPKACATYGYTRQEMLRLSVDDVSSGAPPYTGEDARRWIELAKADRCPPFEWHRRNKDGSLHWDEVRLKPVTIDGRPHVLAVTRDITERKAALQALQAREEQYRAIFDGSVDPMVLWNGRLEVVDVNEAFLRVTGFRREQVVGLHWTQRADHDDLRKLLPLIEGALAGREQRAIDRVARADGTPFDIELRYLPVAFAGERHALGIGRDVTEQIERERVLERSEAQYRGIFNASADALVLRAADFGIVDVNATYEQMSGYRREEVLGVDRVLANPPEDAATIRALHARALAGETIALRTQLLRRDGRRYELELRGVPVEHAGRPHVLYIGRDISQAVQAERQRSELEHQLRQSQKMEAIGQLTGGIAHDFNNILTSVIGYLVLAQERAERLADAALLRQLGSAQLAAGRARDLIAQMLAFARRQRGERRLMALAPLVRQALQLLRSTLPASIVLDTAGLGDGAALPPVQADAVQIEQVLFNLCINARDAMPGSGCITVRLHERGAPAARCASCAQAIEGKRWLEIEVADDGRGIEPEVVQRMFEPFFTTKEVGRGTGMGLAMVHGIVHDHDGHIVVDTSPGRGTTFRVLLPAAVGAAETAAVGGAPGCGARTLLRGRVMVVDDEPMVAAFMTELLEGWGLQVVALNDALAAARWLGDTQQALDLLITDQTMPQMTGLDLAHHAAVLRPELPVLLYSGNVEGLDDDALRRAGVRARLDKPVDPPRLQALLRQWLEPAAATP